ncbi:MAG TPA: carboxypeptidase-like regulatory domain-containing protein [Candidatus Polarisedimenticolaceae bacterium]
MLVAPILASEAVPAAAFPLVAQDTELHGIARDALGRVLSGVEVLVLADGRSGSIVKSAVTDDRGRFRIPSIPPGLYRVAAIKQGYLAQVTRVNTYLRTSFDLVLRPVPRPGEPGGELVAPTSSWMLRVPARSVLRETDPLDLIPTASAVRPPAAPSPSLGLAAAGAPAGPDVRGQVQHLVSLGREGGAGAASSSGVVGGQTSVRLTGALGQRGSLSFSGRRDSIESSDRPLLSPGRRKETGLAVDLSYDTGDDGSIDVTAFYSRGDVQYAAPVALVEPVGEGHTSWGYDATYRRQLDAVTRVAVQFGYADASLRLPGPFLDPADFSGEPRANVTNRSVGAEGTYETVAGDRHQIRVGMRARQLDLAVPWVRSSGGTTFLGLPGAAGLSVRIDAEDQWAVRGPVTVAYGLSLVQALEGREASLIVPRGGVAWVGSRAAVRVSASHHTLMTWQTGAGGESLEVVEPPDALRPERPWGYDLEIELPLPAALRVVGHAEYTPVQDATALSGDVRFEARPPMFVSGARAADRRTSVVVSRPSRRSDLFVELVDGEVRGLLAPSASLDLPVQILDEREIEYRSARAGVRAAAAGTDVSVEYRRSAELPRAAFVVEAPFVSEYWELVFGQSLMRSSRIGASCRVLVSARWAPDVRGGTESLEAERARRIAAFNTRWAAGLLVSF